MLHFWLTWTPSIFLIFIKGYNIAAQAVIAITLCFKKLNEDGTQFRIKIHYGAVILQMFQEVKHNPVPDLVAASELDNRDIQSTLMQNANKCFKRCMQKTKK